MLVLPCAGRLVRDPLSKLPIPSEGKEVPNNAFWRRRIAAGDVRLQVVQPVEELQPVQLVEELQPVEHVKSKDDKKPKK